ncbi:Adenosine monophosphate-protein transferase FICD like protein [Fusarium austroafricanum]|uniref:Adenosine monophosphate-protein transferase FICD like protein n=1 Tax=Fusarium austroafricanum TaxID=2364996 RepID=A0A8H4KDM2_9HYPO|nr:Adenosine monophosphate-protein transferase FICD like protein [Fusarium austroafricanum]
MAPKLKRKSVTDAFDGLTIAGSSRDQEGRATVTDANLGRSIRLHLSSSLRAGGSIHTHSLRGVKATFSIAISDDRDYDYDYDYGNEEIGPDEVHGEFCSLASDVGNNFKKQRASDHELDDYFNDKLAEMIYGSNMIESVGSSFDITIKLCRAIFQGKDVDDAQLGERDAEYQALRAELIKKKLPSEHDAVLRSRREIVQHAQAAHYIISQVAINGKDLSEEIILETHRLLTYKMDTADGISWKEYSGKYREGPVRRGFTSFMHQAGVPAAVRKLISSLEAEIQAAAEEGKIDPVALATKYSHKFVNIHPFADGNSRTSRLILNTLLLKYGGCIVCLGQDTEGREKYMGLAAEAHQSEQEAMGMDDDLPDEYKPKNYKKLASFTLHYARDSMHKVRQFFKREN